MKNLIKLTLLILGLSGWMLNSYAQSTESVEVGVLTTVLNELTLTKSTNVNFGRLSATTSGIVFLDPQETNHNFVGTNANIGKVIISGAYSQSIKISWPTSVTLSDDGSPANTLVWNTQVNGNNTDESSTSTELTDGGDNVTTSNTGNYYLFIGGQLGGIAGTPAALSQQQTGSYSGTANFTVEYN